MNTSSTLAKLVATRICHDLAGPMGGMNNGVEFIDDSDVNDDMLTQAISLLRLSASEGAAKLQMFRQAYGIINDPDGKTEISFLHDLFEQYFKEGKINIVWQEGNIKQIPHFSRQILVNMIIVMANTLLVGGILTIILSQNAEGLSLKVQASGEKIKADENMQHVLLASTDITDISPHNVHCYFLALLAQEVGTLIDFVTEDNHVSISISGLS